MTDSLAEPATSLNPSHGSRAVPNTMRDSRLTVPQLPPRHVSRPRLLAELDNAANSPLTLLSACPGAGKTVLLTNWVRRGRARVAWLNPTAADADPSRFWRLLLSALRECDGLEHGAPAAISHRRSPFSVTSCWRISKSPWVGRMRPSGCCAATGPATSPP